MSSFIELSEQVLASGCKQTLQGTYLYPLLDRELKELNGSSWRLVALVERLRPVDQEEDGMNEEDALAALLETWTFNFAPYSLDHSVLSSSDDGYIHWIIVADWWLLREASDRVRHVPNNALTRCALEHATLDALDWDGMQGTRARTEWIGKLISFLASLGD